MVGSKKVASYDGGAVLPATEPTWRKFTGGTAILPASLDDVPARAQHFDRAAVGVADDAAPPWIGARLADIEKHLRSLNVPQRRWDLRPIDDESIALCVRANDDPLHHYGYPFRPSDRTALERWGAKRLAEAADDKARKRTELENHDAHWLLTARWILRAMRLVRDVQQAFELGRQFCTCETNLSFDVRRGQVHGDITGATNAEARAFNAWIWERYAKLKAEGDPQPVRTLWDSPSYRARAAELRWGTEPPTKAALSQRLKRYAKDLGKK